MSFRVIGPEFLRKLLVPRNRRSHKYDYGHVLIAAGSEGMTGAAVLAARAALKCGAGLVTVACPASQRSIIASYSPEFITAGLSEKDGALCGTSSEELKGMIADGKYSVLLVGPGLSGKESARAFVTGLLGGIKIPVVIDADALNALAVARFFPENGLSVITPHSGEAGRLLGHGINDRRGAVKELAGLMKGTAVLKGPGTLVCSGSDIMENGTGGPALSKAGSGDVLAGFCAGFYSQNCGTAGVSPCTAFESAAEAVFLHGLCGDLAAADLCERCVTASDIVDYLPRAMKYIGVK